MREVEIKFVEDDNEVLKRHQEEKSLRGLSNGSLGSLKGILACFDSSEPQTELSPLREVELSPQIDPTLSSSAPQTDKRALLKDMSKRSTPTCS